ncbi:quinol dehydrogenase ferredoxin subunit NapH [Thiohalomonas denitrificans]|uniref:Ferredoxin-type protein NapH n=1 Tax=Thiohalomonas denitrificans TaxID=415747 RepID=A0A1G5PSA2_9GAMM|nr:quinol dehydrogenase ferredoxin subunit NapH [Thiohalomonas denitrificans]SCZ52424.1 ferredoxin-type protein NapH [Thiohalomonas denitrificans]
MAGYQRLGADAIAAKGWLQAHRWLLLRRLSQVGILVLFLLGPWAGLWIIKGNLSSSLLLDSVPMTEPMVFLQMLAAGFITPVATAITGVFIVTGFYLVVGGRVYCSWVCPLNMVTDAANWLRERLGIKPATRFSYHVRYWMLAMVLLVALASGGMAYELINPVSLVHRGIIFGSGMVWAVVLGVFLFDLFVARRGWCSRICPMGATYGLIGKFSLMRVRADRREACNDCMECFAVCPEPQVIRPALKGAEQNTGPAILAGECTNCGRCIDICSKDVFNFGTRFQVKQ